MGVYRPFNRSVLPNTQTNKPELITHTILLELKCMRRYLSLTKWLLLLKYLCLAQGILALDVTSCVERVVGLSESYKAYHSIYSDVAYGNSFDLSADFKNGYYTVYEMHSSIVGSGNKLSRA